MESADFDTTLLLFHKNPRGQSSLVDSECGLRAVEGFLPGLVGGTFVPVRRERLSLSGKGIVEPPKYLPWLRKRGFGAVIRAMTTYWL